jgi:tetratricopeptide (TPR) repeat protein
MNEHSRGRDTSEDVAETNLRNLLDKAYDPPSPSPIFQRELTETLARRGADSSAQRRSRGRWRIPLAVAAAALIALAGWYAGQQSTPPTGEGAGSGAVAGNERRKEHRTDADANELLTDGTPVAREESPKPPANPLPEAEFRVPRARPNAMGALVSTRVPMDPPADANVPSLGIDQAISTGRGEKRLVTLPDGSTLMVNEQSSLRVTGHRSLTLNRGEVYLEVPRHRGDGDTPETFTVRTPRRKVTALGTHFGISARGDDTDVLVTQGQVRVDGLARKLQAGEICTAAGDVLTVRPLPRATVALDWIRQLVARANTPLVPDSKHAGGRLVARTRAGREAPLTLRKLHVDVHIEDGFARTTIVQTYFNHLNMRTEGTFLFPLPRDASLSRLAMYVAGKRMEGGMVVRERGREIYDDIVRSMQDPALLEWVDGTTFRMSVFPLEARQEKVILLSYTQRLDDEYGRQSYRFPAGHSLGKVREWSCRIRLTDPNARWKCTSHELTHRTDPNGQAVLTGSAKEIEPTEDIVLTLTSEGAGWREGQDIPEQTDVRSFAGRKRKYLMVRHRPKLPVEPSPQARHWVFVHETSADRDPLLTRAQIELLKGVLHCAAAGDTFQVITAAHTAKVLTPRPIAVSAETVKAVTDALGKTHILGALDLKAALRSAGTLAAARPGNACIVYLGAARTVLGSRDVWKLAGQLDANVPFVGVAVGKRYNRDFLSLAARRSGGLYENIHPDENLRWRAMDLVATLNTPRLTDLTVTAKVDGNALPLLPVDTMVGHGEQICLAGAVDITKKLPQAVTIKGLLNGKPWQKRIACKPQDANAGYLPRLWAKLEIDRLVELHARTGKYEHRQEAIRLSRDMYVMCPWTSLIVLENEAMYLRYDVEQGRSDHWAMYPAPAKMKVVYQPRRRVLREDSWRLGAESPNAPTPCEASWKARLRATIRTHELASGETLVARARKLLAGGKYKRARDVLDEALRVAPGHIEARLLSGWLTTALQATDRDTGQDQGVSLGMGSTPWYELIRYPRSWQEIAGERKSNDIGRSAGPQADSRTRRMLRRKIPRVDFQGIQLENVLAFIRDVSGANILPNWEVLADRNITPSTRVTVEKLRNVSIEQLLELVLDSAGGTQVELGYVIRNGNVQISTTDEIRMRSIQRVYDVRGLVPETIEMPEDVRPILTAEDRRLAARQLEQIVSMIKETTPMDSWAYHGGRASLRVFPGYVMVNQTQEMHERIGDLLTMLRYPKDWPARKAMLRWLALRHQGESSANIRARQALAQTITIDNRTRVKLSAFVDFLRDVTEQNVYVEWSCLRSRGVDGRSEVTVPAGKAVRLRDLAESVLGQFGGVQHPCTIVVKDGLIRITTREAAQQQFVHRMYDIRDLLAPSPHTPQPAMPRLEMLEDLLETPGGLFGDDDGESTLFGDDDDEEIDWIRPRDDRGTEVHDIRDLIIPAPDLVGPSRDIGDKNSGSSGLFGDDDDGFYDDDNLGSESISRRQDRLMSAFKEAAPLDVWIEQGGPASLRFFRGQLVVNAPHETHQTIREILDLLRQTYRPQPAGPMLIQVGCGRLASLDLSKTHFDLPTAYAPGFITTLADVAAVLESEGPHRPIPFGKMDNAAVDRLDRARRKARSRTGENGWTVARRPGETIVFHVDGRYAITRTAGAGLKERVFCDGNSLYHVYPELGLATRRRVSRFHRLAAGFEVPWLIPTNTVLQKGASVEYDGNGVIVSRPLKDGPGLRPALRFELENDTVVGREWVHAGRTLRGISVKSDGHVVETLPDGQQRHRRYSFSHGETVPQRPDLTDLVVLEMPIRSPEHVLTSRRLNLYEWSRWREADALAYVAATALPTSSSWSWQAGGVLREQFFRKGDGRVGLGILAMAGGGEPNVPSAIAKTDVGRYMRLADGGTLAKGETWTDPNGFLAELAKLRALWSRLHSPDAPDPDARWIAAALNTLGEIHPSVVSWAVASEMSEHAVTTRHRRKLAAILDRHAKALEQIRIPAGYTAARCLDAAGARAEAADRFEKLIAAMARDTVAPIVDSQIRRTLGPKRWAQAIGSAASTLHDANAVMPAMQLAWMTIRAGDREGGLAVLEGSVRAAPRTDRILAAVTALEICRSLHEWDLAERLVAELADAPRVVRSAGFWRIAATTALQHGSVTEYGLRLARALSLDYHSGRAIPAERFAEEHRLAMESLANAARTVTRDDADTRRKLAVEMIRLADRARVVFPHNSVGILNTASRGLMQLGADDLAWGYLTTPLAGRGDNPEAWNDLAWRLAETDRHDLAADSKLIAARLSPDSLDAAWEAGEMLEQADRIDEAVAVYRHALTRKGENDWDRRIATDIADRLKRLTGKEVPLPDHLKD